MEIKDNTALTENAESGTEQGAEAQQDTGSAVPASYGKFASADALWKAYNSLQAEFTRRSQRLKELEKEEERKTTQTATEVPTPEANASVPPSQPSTSPTEELFRRANADEEVRRRIVEDYLLEVRKGAVPLMQSGTGVLCPPDKPKTLSDAGRMALGYFRNNR